MSSTVRGAELDAEAGPSGFRAARIRLSRRQIRDGLIAWAFLAPAVTAFGLLVLKPLVTSMQYSAYSWDGIGAAKPVGLGNYRQLFTQPALRDSILHSFVLIVFFSVIPVFLGLALASIVARITGTFGTAARIVLFLPQILPLAASGIAWKWVDSSDGVINQSLRLVGLASLARPWLGNFTTALPALGLIGTWALTGFCLVLLCTGLSKIDRSLFEAARLDGAGAMREFFSITVPSLRREISVVLTITIIAALQSFDVVYVTTQGGPGEATAIPGLTIYQLAFVDNQVGLASALGVVLTILVFVIVLPVQHLVAGKR
jgi:raffinose/stachyose/melibiose transport system permease protein